MARPNPRRIVVAAAPGSVDHLLADLDLPEPATTLVVNGGTSDDPDFPVEAVTVALRAVLAELSRRPGPVIISGGTDAGLFRQLGAVVAEVGFNGPVVGVVPAGKINSPDGTTLERRHTHALLVAGDRWGDETMTMLELCRLLDRRGPAVALVAGGGSRTRVEIDGHRADHRPVLVLAGTGRLADELGAGPRPAGLTFVDVADPLAVGSAVARALG